MNHKSNKNEVFIYINILLFAFYCIKKDYSEHITNEWKTIILKEWLVLWS